MFTRMFGLALAAVLLPAITFASPKADLERAARKGQAAFLLIKDAGTPGLEPVRSTIQAAIRQTSNAIMVEVDRQDPANAALVSKLRVGTAPVPLILVAARNGVVAGGTEAGKATAETLAAMIPSPAKAAILRAVEEKKPVYLVASRKGMKDVPKAMSACEKACAEVQGKPVTVKVDLDDPRERAFLDQLSIDRATTTPVTLVVNAQGQVTGTYDGQVDVAKLVQDASRKATGCCPPSVQGGASSCAPKK